MVLVLGLLSAVVGVRSNFINDVMCSAEKADPGHSVIVFETTNL